MKLLKTSLNMMYPKIVDYRRNFVLTEDVLKKDFQPANLLPVPDEIPDEVPRIVAQTKGGHSVLNIGLNAISFLTNYDGSYVNDWMVSSSYLEEKGKLIYEVMDKLTGKRYSYVGVVAVLEVDNENEDVLDVLKKSLIRDHGKDIGDPYSLGVKLTYVQEDKYFVNISLETIKKYKAIKDKDGELISNTYDSSFIGITVDVNDRFAFEHIQGYHSSQKAFERILAIITELVDGKLEKLILEGRFVHCVE